MRKFALFLCAIMLMLPLLPAPITAHAAPTYDTPEDFIEAYFDDLYDGYLKMRYVDISDYLDLEQPGMKNMTVWLRMLAQRRRLLDKHDLCYVETKRFAYKIVYDDKAEDKRMEYWEKLDDEQADITLHFRIKGVEGRAYPPFMAVNAQQTISLKEVDGEYKIIRHYFPGSVRKFITSGTLKLAKDETVLRELREEFSSRTRPAALEVPKDGRAYNASQAVKYALRYTEKPNKRFYHAGDWMGNCSNFVSQCVWYGLGTGKTTSPAGLPWMTKNWYGGPGGGTPAWENVGYFWADIVKAGGLTGQKLGGVGAMRAGDLMQTRTRGRSSYSHMLILVDKDKLIFGQNSPGCFVYYADMPNMDMRFVHSSYIAPQSE